MKKTTSILLALLLCAALLTGCGSSAAPTAAPATAAPVSGSDVQTEAPLPASPTDLEAPYPVMARLGETISADLDGDGKDEQILWDAVLDQSSWQYTTTLTVNGTDFASKLQDMGYYCESVMDYWAVVDLDVSDAAREIAIFDDGPSDDPNTLFFRYADGKLTLLGAIYGMLSDDGSGQTYHGDGTVDSWLRLDVLQTWFADCTYGLGSDGKLSVIPQDLYYPKGDYGLSLKTLMELPLYTENNANVQAELAPAGTALTLTATDNAEWVQAQTSDGRTVWLHLNAEHPFQVETTSGYVSVQDALDGLCMAD